MTNFESAVHNTMLWKVPGRPPLNTTDGRSDRMVEAIDIFPTLVELAGLPDLPTCTGLDQPPTVECVQGTSYADLFTAPATATNTHRNDAPTPKQFVFSQWPFPAWGPQSELRMGYTVRSSTGFRLTEYVPYNTHNFTGQWSTPPYNDTDDLELYDYNVDPWETVNAAYNASYASVVELLRGVLRHQYVQQNQLL